MGAGDLDPRRVAANLAKIIDAEAAIFGGLPYSEPYLFILHLNNKGRGGLEHRRSCALLVPRFFFIPRARYEDFLQLVAHEFFHLWNVKRLRPSAFTPYELDAREPPAATLGHGRAGFNVRGDGPAARRPR